MDNTNNFLESTTEDLEEGEPPYSDNSWLTSIPAYPDERINLAGFFESLPNIQNNFEVYQPPTQILGAGSQVNPLTHYESPLTDFRLFLGPSYPYNQPSLGQSAAMDGLTMGEADTPTAREEAANNFAPNNDNPLRCTFPICPRQEPFPNMSTLQKHIDRHTRPYTCESSDCVNQTFADEGGLRRHRREVHGSTKFCCPVSTCRRHTRGFSRKYNLQEHQRKCHSISGQSYSQDSDGSPPPHVAHQHYTAFQGQEVNLHANGVTRDDKIKEMIRQLRQEISTREIKIATLEAALG